ncbi:MAG: hypothetical protein PHX61_02610 [Alphaproteobacteria bacterium]|nr:hypothetical protein [Alphaproteobacteria bacterium]
MKFETKDGTCFEVSNLECIVINTVRQIIKPAEFTMDVRGHTQIKPARVTSKTERVEDKGTRVWYRLKFVRGIRWAKFRYAGTIPDVSGDPDLNLADAVQWGTPDEIQKIITEAMQRPDIRLWFSGSYCNIQICENWQEVRKIQAQEANRKRRHQAARLLKSQDLDKIIGDALQQSTARLRQESIDTPFGPVPVMTVIGSGKHEIIPGPCAAVIGRRKLR